MITLTSSDSTITSVGSHNGQTPAMHGYSYVERTGTVTSDWARKTPFSMSMTIATRTLKEKTISKNGPDHMRSFYLGQVNRPKRPNQSK